MVWHYDPGKYKLCLCPPRWRIQPHFCRVMVCWCLVSCDICAWQSMQLLKYLIVKGDHCPTSIPLNILSALLSERMVFEFIERLTHIASQGHNQTEWHYTSRISSGLNGATVQCTEVFFFFFWTILMHDLILVKYEKCQAIILCYQGRFNFICLHGVHLWKTPHAWIWFSSALSPASSTDKVLEMKSLGSLWMPLWCLFCTV